MSPYREGKQEKTVDSLHNPLLLSISEHCFVVMLLKNNGKILLFVSRAEILLKGGFFGEKKMLKRQHNNMTWMVIAVLLPLPNKTFFMHFSTSNRRENPFMRSLLLWAAKDAWGRTFGITFYLWPFVRWEIILIFQFFLQLVATQNNFPHRIRLKNAKWSNFCSDFPPIYSFSFTFNLSLFPHFSWDVLNHSQPIFHFFITVNLLLHFSFMRSGFRQEQTFAQFPFSRTKINVIWRWTTFNLSIFIRFELNLN